jgi:hypothetical protein
MEFDLPAEIQWLHAETTWSTRHNARTLIKYDDFRVVLTALQASARVPEHKTDGRISVHVLSGHIQVRAQGGRSVSARAVSLQLIKASLTTSTHSKIARSPHDVLARQRMRCCAFMQWSSRR